MRASAEVVVHQQVTFTVPAAGIGFITPIPLDHLGVRGHLLAVKVRQPLGGDVASINLWVADRVASPMLTQRPNGEDTFFRALGVLTPASDIDSCFEVDLRMIGWGAYYVSRDQDVAVGLEVLAGAVNGGEIIVDVWAKCQGSLSA